MNKTYTIIRNKKKDTFDGAKEQAIPVKNSNNICIGYLVPVGGWIFSDSKKIESICVWRQKAMEMFLSQFQSTYDRTLGYLKNVIEQERRIFFLIYDDANKFVGHIGITDVENNKYELDNLIRGISGGDPKLIYFSEIALLDWCFRSLGLAYSILGVFSYNRMVITLHEEVGYVITEQVPLRKYKKNDTILHDSVNEIDANVSYLYTKMLLEKMDFYSKAYWLKQPNAT